MGLSDENLVGQFNPLVLLGLGAVAAMVLLTVVICAKSGRTQAPAAAPSRQQNS